MSRLAGSLCCLAVFAVLVLSSSALGRQEKQEQRIARLIEQLGDDAQATRDDAELTLKEIGEPALPLLLKAAKHEDLEIRRRVARLLPLLSEAKAKRLLANLQSKEKATRQAAAKQLCELLDERGEPYQRKAVLDVVTSAMENRPNAVASKEAAEVVALVYVPRIKKLIEQLGDDEFRKRTLAERELLRIGKPALELLKREAKNPDLEIRNRSQKLVARIQSAR